MIRLVLYRLFESYFRHRWLYLLPIVMMTGLSVYYVFYRVEPKYISQGVLYVQGESLLASLTAVSSSSTNWWMTPSQAVSRQVTDLMQTNAFVRAVIAQTKLESEMNQGDDVVNEILGQTRSNVWVSTIGDNQISINAADEDPELAYQLVNATLESYLQWQINARRAESESAQGFFSELITTYEEELSAARLNMEEFLRNNPAPIRGERPGGEQLEIERLQATIDLAAARYASALDKEENSRLAMAQIESDMRQTYFVIDAPRLPTDPETSLRETIMNMAIFVVVGFLLSGGAIVGSAILDRSFRLPVDVQSRLDLPVLAEVPDISPRKRRFWQPKPKAAGLEESKRVQGDSTEQEPSPAEVAV
ncbi:MAG: lipopolysaccharide biosynthesis protein [Chloroflexi bacterium]|nr:lipopolysaccharide biosynthesis protein [Chloroflexota bacterium]